MSVACVILAAGLGTRMKSRCAKVLHEVGGVPMIHHPVALARALDAARVVVVLGHQLETVRDFLVGRFGDASVVIVEQREQLGTGHAVMAALPALADFTGAVVILYGDVPLLEPATVARLVAARTGPLALVTTRPPDPTGYGRIVRDAAGLVLRVVEEQDATAAERAIGEVNAGIYCVDAPFLRRAVAALRRDNAQGELYLTDLVAEAAAAAPVAAVAAPAEEVMGINDRIELARADAAWRRRACERLMRGGVTVRDPATCFLGVDVTVERDVDLGPLVVLRGRTVVGEGAVIEAGCVLEDCTVGAGAHVGAHAVLVRCDVPPGGRVAPFARRTDRG